MKIDLSKHCQLCDNQIYDIQSGTKCGLTNKRPNFTSKCPDIKFETNYEERIKEINTELELVKRTKSLSIANFIFFIVISLAIVLGGYLLGTYAFDKGVISTIPLTIMGVGILILPLASGPLNKYRQKIKITQKRKLELDELLLKYNIEYTIDLTFHKDLHGNLDITTILNFQRKHYR
ncbi:hypothetical protein [uncultured Roseivirga sp.]|uniref:hypothetical protein n=1 Tax=uncultured Roseivirga sp. TaxID=543088 RepID=UPI0030D846C7|tara:strand:- start:123383 stop:123916 length:534 start_codon:yes stop_codon:yes gene_type:complete